MKALLFVQASYMFITAVWPIVDIDGFMIVTGFKTDIWLVKTVSLLLLPICFTLWYFAFFKTDERPAIVLGTMTSLAFIGVDFYYALNDVIPDVYIIDGVIEIGFLIAWVYIIIARKRSRHFLRKF